MTTSSTDAVLDLVLSLFEDNLQPALELELSAVEEEGLQTVLTFGPFATLSCGLLLVEGGMQHAV